MLVSEAKYCTADSAPVSDRCLVNDPVKHLKMSSDNPSVFHNPETGSVHDAVSASDTSGTRRFITAVLPFDQIRPSRRPSQHHAGDIPLMLFRDNCFLFRLRSTSALEMTKDRVLFTGDE